MHSQNLLRRHFFVRLGIRSFGERFVGFFWRYCGSQGCPKTRGSQKRRRNITAHTEAGRFYGRVFGKKIGKRGQDLLRTFWPQVRYRGQPFQNEHLWSLPVKTRVLEIGFGGGEYMTSRLRDNPTLGFFGVEPFRNGLVKVLSSIVNDPLLWKRLCLSNNPIEASWTMFPDNFFDEVIILFPDPWPKKKHHKRRLITPSTLQHITRVLAQEGLLKIATDDQSYFADILRSLTQQETLMHKEGAQSSALSTWPLWPKTWPLTRYGEKALTREVPLGHTVWKKCHDPPHNADQ